MIERLLPGRLDSRRIVHVDGRVLGRHAGIVHYTIGQRRGLGVAATSHSMSSRSMRPPRGCWSARAPRSPDASHAPRSQLDRRRRACRCAGDGTPIAARVRSTRPPAAALLLPTGEVEFAEPESGVSPGQACVFYELLDARARVLGGGFIAAS